MKHEKALLKLKTARGQIDSVIKMIEDERYCLDISNQLMAVEALLNGANVDVLEGHIRTCLTDAIKEGDEIAEEKIKEIVYALKRATK